MSRKCRLPARRVARHAGEEAVLAEQRLDVARASAIRSGGTQTSSMISDVPCGRSSPTMPCIPSRTRQKTSVSSRIARERGGLAAARGRRARPARARSSPSSSRGVVGAQLDQQHGALGRELVPLLRDPRQRVRRRDQRRRHHQLDRARARLDQRRARAPPPRRCSAKNSSAGRGRGGRAARSRTRPRRRSASVPSEPTSRRRKISTGSSASRNAHSR